MYCAVCNCGGEIALIVVFFSTKKMHRKITIYSFFHFFEYHIRGRKICQTRFNIFDDCSWFNGHIDLLFAITCYVLSIVSIHADGTLSNFHFSSICRSVTNLCHLKYFDFYQIEKRFFFQTRRENFFFEKNEIGVKKKRERGKKYNYQMRFVVYEISENCRNLVSRNSNSLRFY